MEPHFDGSRLCNNCRKIDVRQLLLDSKAAYEKQPTEDSLYPDRAEFAPNLTMQEHSIGQVSKFGAGMFSDCSLCCLFCRTATTGDMLYSGLQSQLYIGINTSLTCYNPVIQHGPTPRKEFYSYSQLEIFADSDSLPREDQQLVGQSVHLDPSSIPFINLVRKWRLDCETYHIDCKVYDKEPPQLPDRVIEVSPKYGNGAPRVISTHGARGFWTALSYCWGSESLFQLTSESKEKFEEGMDLSQWPATLRDAVLITQQQGVQYLWIDAVCILQDSPEDWETQAANMYNVYRLSLFTIVAAGCPSVSHGILRPRKPVPPMIRLPWKHPDGVARWVNLRRHMIGGLLDESLRKDLYFNRSWTMQEALLSRRLLIYTDYQAIWSCETCQTDEKGRVYPPTTPVHFPFEDVTTSVAPKPLFSLLRQYTLDETKASADFGMSPWLYWQVNVLHEYGRRRCTLERDVLTAMSGMAKAFQKFTGDTYLAGLWKKVLIPMLTWTRWPIGRPSLVNSVLCKYDDVSDASYQVRSRSRDTSERCDAVSWKEKAAFLEAERDEAYHYMSERRLLRSKSVDSGLSLYDTQRIFRGQAYADHRKDSPEDTLNNGAGSHEIMRQWMRNLEARDCLVNDISPPSTYIAPSWSWASIKGDRIHHYYFPELFSEIWSCTINSVSVDLSSSNPFGAVNGGSMEVRAPMRRIPYADNGHLDHINFDPVAKPLPALVSDVSNDIEDELYGRPGWLNMFEFVQQHRPCEEQQFFLLFLAHIKLTAPDEKFSLRPQEKKILLLLESTPARGVYRRIGLQESFKRRFSFFEAEEAEVFASIDTWKERTVTII